MVRSLFKQVDQEELKDKQLPTATFALYHLFQVDDGSREFHHRILAVVLDELG